MRTVRRERTVAIAEDEIDFMVLQFSCVDSSILSTIGKHCQETTWKIVAGGVTVPIDINLHIDKSVIGSPQVSVKWDGNQVFPAGAATKAKLNQDLIWKVPFRGMIKGLTVPDFFELRPEHHLSDDWYSATLLEQRADGLFKALAKMPDGNGGIKEVNYPAVKSENIREAAGTKKPVCAPHRELVLKVPQDDPLRSAVLSVDNQEHVTHFFARPTPPPSRDGQDGAARLVKPRILFKVTQQREKVVVDAGHAVLSHFLSGDIRSLRQSTSRTAKTWTFQFGPFAEHLVEIERRYKSSKAITLSVDGEVLCEGEAEDIDSRPGMWECKFQLVGERYIDWEVYESDVNGRTLDSTDIVRQRHKYSQECVVSMPEGERDLATAKLAMGGVDFPELPEVREQAFSDEQLELAPEALLGSYGLIVPYKVNEKAPMGFSAWADKLREGKLIQGRGLFFCCGSTPLGKEEVHRPG